MGISEGSPDPLPPAVESAAWCMEAHRILGLEHSLEHTQEHSQAHSRTSPAESPGKPPASQLMDERASTSAVAQGRSAIEAAKLQFAQLQTAFRQGGGIHGAEIADKGLPATLARILQPIELCVARLSAAEPGDTAARSKIRKRVAAAIAEVQGDSFLELLERNPYRIAFNVRRDLANALARISDACREQQHEHP